MMIIQLFIACSIVFIIRFVWELQSVFARIKLSTKGGRGSNNGELYFEVTSFEPKQIICSAKLEKAFAIINHNGMLLPLPIHDVGEKLKWKFQISKEKEEDNAIINPYDSRKAIFAEITSQGVSLANGSNISSMPRNGLFLGKIRIDGIIGDKSICPRYIKVFIYVENILLNDGAIMPHRVFRAGNWKRCKDIPETLRKRRIAKTESFKSF